MFEQEITVFSVSNNYNLRIIETEPAKEGLSE